MYSNILPVESFGFLKYTITVNNEFMSPFYMCVCVRTCFSLFLVLLHLLVPLGKQRIEVVVTSIPVLW